MSFNEKNMMKKKYEIYFTITNRRKKDRRLLTVDMLACVPPCRNKDRRLFYILDGIKIGAVFSDASVEFEFEEVK